MICLAAPTPPEPAPDPARVHNSETPPLVGVWDASAHEKKRGKPQLVKAARSSRQTCGLIYRLPDSSDSARSSDRRALQSPSAARRASLLLSIRLPALPRSRPLRSPRRQNARLARPGRFSGPSALHPDRPLAMPKVPPRVYRLSRFSYSPINASPPPVCCNSRETISNTTGRPTGKRPAPPAACPFGMNHPPGRPTSPCAPCTWPPSGNC